MKYDLEKLRADKIAAYLAWDEACTQAAGEPLTERAAREKAAMERWQDLAHAESAARYGAHAETRQRILDLRDTYLIKE